MKINYCVQIPTEAEASPPTGTFEVPDASNNRCNLATIKQYFPFEGKFHFRAKQVIGGEEHNYVWRDLQEADSIPANADGVISIRCLPLFEVCVDDDTDAFTWTPDEFAAWQASRNEGAEPFSLQQYPLSAEAPAAATVASSVSSWFGGEAPVERASSSWFASSSPAAAAPAETAPSASSGSWWSMSTAAPVPAPAAASQESNAPMDPFADEKQAGGNTSEQHGEEHSHHAAGEGGGNLFRGIMSAASKAATVAATAAVSAAETVEKKGWFSNISKKVSKALATMVAAPPGEPTMENIRQLRSIFQTPFKPTNDTHIMLLERLWHGAFPSKSFERKSAVWKTLGFKSEDPASDLTPAGAMLGLEVVVHFAEKHVGVFEALFESNKSAVSSYPLVLVVITITMRVAREILFVTQSEEELWKNKQVYWELFAGPQGKTAAFELCIATAWAFDHIWHLNRANLDQFSKILEDAMTKAKGWVNQAPTSRDHLIAILDGEGIRL